MRILVCVMELNLFVISRINNCDHSAYYGKKSFVEIEQLIRKNYPKIKKAVAYLFERDLGYAYKLKTGTYYKRQLTVNIYRGKFYFTFQNICSNCNTKHSANIRKHLKKKKYYNLEETINFLRGFIE